MHALGAGSFAAAVRQINHDAVRLRVFKQRLRRSKTLPEIVAGQLSAPNDDES